MDSSKAKIGAIAEELVMKKLRKYNYRVRRLPKGSVDLIVDDHEVEVKSAKMTKYGSWSFAFNSGTPRNTDADGYALVFNYPDGSARISYIKSKDLKQVMRQNGSRWNVSFRSPLDEALSKSPYAVFGYPQYAVEKGLTPKLGGVN